MRQKIVNFSRQQLYALGEPLGECATRTKPGGGRIYGGGGGGSSSSSSATTNTDKRLAVGDGGAGITGDNSSIIVNALDGGAIKAAFDFAKAADTTNADGFGKLLDASLQMFNASENLIGQTQKSVADAYSAAQTEKSGSIDQKTMIIIAVAGAVALVLVNRSK